MARDLPATQTFSVATATVTLASHPERLEVSIDGEVDIANGASIRELLASHLDTAHDDVVVDLSGLDYIDSAGLNVLLDLRSRLATHRRRLHRRRLHLLAPPGSAARRILILSGLADLFGEGRA